VDEPVRLVASDPAWPAAFKAEASRLEELIGPWLTGDLHHVGSTAVPGMSAKPVVDILGGVASLPESAPCIAVLQSADWWYAPYLPDVMHWFCKPSPAHRTHHLHLVPTGSQRFVSELVFRDGLRSDAAVAADYLRLKRRLAARFPDDREAYTAGKAGFIEETVRAVLGVGG